ncbi:sigma-70 family RNA polymerase sigma factor [Coraliomargarita algicola]|uniref:Sigma-70 family RNA polymerase sigma factor n=1 Tax=Coraliomargarita algicola TaxID=3092156 RepID=A0ABZ0RVR7_9BACT|nr:sigma-70 family RNA polymerase sigma factor [Coraliomargarita sp. J2-16]WPJ97069.1 sigma-70 family RNA polymerase sigma factor [Coraliomargarita sp. J2-16]
MSDYPKTSYTLIHRACDTSDDAAWERLFANYERFIRYILREIGVSDNDLPDVTQQVLIGLTRSLKSYDRAKSSFRHWLSTVIRNTAVSYFRKQQSRPTSDCTLEDDSLKELEQPAEVGQWIEREWTTYLANQAMARVRKVFKGQAIQAFEMGLDGFTAAEISEATGLTVSSVYTLRKRVKQRLLLEVRSLTEELEP